MKTRVLMLGTNANDLNIFVRCFRAVLDKYEVTIITEAQHIPNVMTHFGRISVIPIRNLSVDCLMEYLQEHASEYDILMPSGFGSLKILAANFDRISDLIRVIALPDIGLIDQLDDKLPFAHFCTMHGLPHPETYQGTDFFENVQSAATFPLLLKHRLGAGKQGIRLVTDFEDALAGAEVAKPEEYIAQQYLPGSDFAFNGFCRNGVIVSWTVQQFYSVRILGRDRLRISTFVRNDAIYALSEKLISITEYSGPINIDFRYVESTDRYYFIEVNPRFWANTHYSLIDGVNFIDIALDSSIPAGKIRPQYAGKTWGEPIRTAILMICFFRFGLMRYLLSQSLMQFKIGWFDRFDRLLSRYQATRAATMDT